jgi:hypothetical protein
MDHIGIDVHKKESQICVVDGYILGFVQPAEAKGSLTAMTIRDGGLDDAGGHARLAHHYESKISQLN